MIRSLLILQLPFLFLAAMLACVGVYWLSEPMIPSYLGILIVLMLLHALLSRSGPRIASFRVAAPMLLAGAVIAVWVYRPLHLASWSQASFWQALKIGALGVASLYASHLAARRSIRGRLSLPAAFAVLALFWVPAIDYPPLPLLGVGLVLAAALPLASGKDASGDATPPGPASPAGSSLARYVIFLAAMDLGATISDYQLNTVWAGHVALGLLAAAAGAWLGRAATHRALTAGALLGGTIFLGPLLIPDLILHPVDAIGAGLAMGVGYAYLSAREGAAALVGASFSWGFGLTLALALGQHRSYFDWRTVLLVPLLILLLGERRAAEAGDGDGPSKSPLSRLARAVLRALPAATRVALVMIAIQVAIGTVFRWVFWLMFRSTTGDLATPDVLRAWYLGLKFDFRLALWVCLPFLLLGLLPFLNPVRSRVARGLWLGYFVLVQALVLLAYSVDLGYYDYLRVRLDAGLMDLVAEPAIALGMVWETYPVIPGVLAALAVMAVYALLIRRLAFSALHTAAPAPHRWRRRLAVLAFTLLYALGIYGKWSWYPLRWSDAFFSREPFISALGLNPVLFFVDTFPNRRAAYDEEAVRRSYDRVAGLLGVTEPDPEHLSFARRVVPKERPERPLNLVVIHLESFSAYKAGAFGNEMGATPAFDAVADQAILFSRFFVPSGPTARSIFTMSTGIPDLNPLRSASRNPRAVRQHMVVNALRGYDKYFFLGGSATWGNIRGLMAHNIENLQIYEEGSYEIERSDVWGVSDLALFETAHEVLRENQGPFFAFIQTAGNHRPYTIPEDAGGFELKEVDEQVLEANGFENLDAFNAMRFLDYSLGRFLELARQEPYFTDTVFAFYGDHGGPSPRSTPWDALGLTTNHVPGVIYAPGLPGGGRRIEGTASLVDLLPTSLSLMGVPYLATTFGRDLLAEPPLPHFAKLSDGVITDDFLLRVDPSGQSVLFQYDGPEPALNVAERYPEDRDRLRQLHEALDETARYLMYHNPPQPHPRPRENRTELP